MLSLPCTFRDSQNLGFVLELGCSPWTLPTLTSSSCHTASGSSGSWKFFTPDPISVYSKVSTLVSVRLCFPVSPIHVTSHSCVYLLHFRYPRPNDLLSILLYKTPAYVCIRHVQISTLILVFIVYSTHSMTLHSDSVLPE